MAPHRAGYGYCASHSRRFWGLRLHLVTTVHGLPVAFALTNPKVDERDVLVDLVSLHPNMFHHPDGLILVVDKGYRDRGTENWLNETGITVVRPAYRNETPRPGRVLLRAVRQTIESVNDTLKDQLGPERQRPYRRRRGRPTPSAHPRADRRDLAQLAHRPTDHAFPDRVRPLTPWNR